MDELKKKLSRHIEIDSVFPEEADYGEFIERRLRDNGFKTERQEVEEDRFNVQAEKGTGEITVAFYGHLDTVPPYGDWSREPNEPWTEGNKMIGLGALDMKSGNLAILEATENIPDGVKVKVAFGVDEEYMSKGSTALVKEKWASDADILIVPEKDDKVTHKDIGMGRRGRISIDVRVKGESAHAAHPEKGKNAIKESKKLIREIEKIELGSDKDLGKGELTIRSMKSDAGSLSIPDEAKMIIDRHMVPGETIEGCINQIREAVETAEVDAEVKLRDRPTPYLKPYKTEKSAVKDFSKVVSSMFGKPELKYGSSVADENRFAELDIPIITYGPIGKNEHAADEEVDLRSVKQLIRVYNKYLEKISK
ncbi:MAG: M20 family metallopeptidase [Candidatus Nanohaloarchaea archaeon]